MSILVMHDDDREFTESFNKNFTNFVEPCNVYRCKISSTLLFFFVYLFLHLNLTLAAWIEYIVVAVTTHD